MVLAGNMKLRPRPLPRIQRWGDAAIGTTFTLFPKLPPELRNRVWYWALPRARELSVGGWEHPWARDVEYTITASQQLPQDMQLACKEARGVFLYHYTPVHQSLLSLPEHQDRTQSLRFRPVYVDFRMDTIIITKFGNDTRSLHDALQVLGTSVPLVRHLVIDASFVTQEAKRDPTLQTIHALPQLQNLTIMVAEPDRAVLPFINRHLEPADPLPALGIMSWTDLREAMKFQKNEGRRAWMSTVQADLSHLFAEAWVPSMGKADPSITATEQARFNNMGVCGLASPGKITIQLGMEHLCCIAIQRWHEPETRQLDKAGRPVRHPINRMRWYVRSTPPPRGLREWYFAAHFEEDMGRKLG